MNLAMNRRSMKSRTYSRPMLEQVAKAEPSQASQSAYSAARFQPSSASCHAPTELHAQLIVVWWRDVIDGQKGCQPTCVDDGDSAGAAGPYA